MKNRKNLLWLILFSFTIFFISSCGDSKININLDSGVARYGTWTSSAPLNLIDKNGNLDSSKYIKIYQNAVSFTSNNDQSIFYLDTRGIGGKEFGGILFGKYDESNSSVFSGKFYNMADKTKAPLPFALKLPAKKDELVATNPEVLLTLGENTYKGRLEPNAKTVYFVSEMVFNSERGDTNSDGFYQEGIAFADSKGFATSSNGGGCSFTSKNGSNIVPVRTNDIGMKFTILDPKNFSNTTPKKDAQETDEQFKTRKQAYENQVKAWHNSSSTYKVESLDTNCKLSFELTKDNKYTIPTYKISKVANIQGCNILKNLSNGDYEGFGATFRDSPFFGRFKGSVANGTDAFYIDCEMHRRVFK